MKLLILSDTHGKLHYAKWAIEGLLPHGLTHVLHCGDVVRDQKSLQKLYPEITVIGVKGNCDGWGAGDEDLLIYIDGVPIYMAHGHKHGVKQDLDTLLIDAKAHEAKVAIFGHTHHAFKGWNDGILIVNPGSISMPRDTMYPSYAIIDLCDGHIENVSLWTIQGKDQISPHPF